MGPTRLDYAQFLISSQINFTLTYCADHTEKFSHDALNRYLAGEKLTPSLVWENVRESVVISPRGCIVFDDTVLDKRHSRHIEMVRRQYSGNAHSIIRGIGMVNCLYVNPETGQYWIIDFRLFDPDRDGKTKLDHVHDMLTRVVEDKRVPFAMVLMDTWYATRELMLFIESLEKVYYCPLKDNRLVDDSGAQKDYQRADSLQWSEHDVLHGKIVKIKNFPRDHKVRLFRVEVSTHRTDWIASNDLAQDSTDVAQKACAIRWKIEQFHRELKQTTGVQGCQCRKARIQRNHITIAVLVWIHLTRIARETAQTIYQLKFSLLDNYLRQQLRSPSINIQLA